MYDFEINSEFNQTMVTIAAITEKAKAFFAEMFGAGAISVNMPQSKVQDLAIFIQRKGFTIV